MSYNIAIQTNAGLFWLTRSVWMGLADLTKDRTKASKFLNPMILEEAKKYCKEAYFGYSPFQVINKEVE